MARPPAQTNVRSAYLEHAYRILSDLALQCPTRSQNDVLRMAEDVYQVVWGWRPSPVTPDEVERVQNRLGAFWKQIEREYPTMRVTAFDDRIAHAGLKPIQVARGLERHVLLRLDDKAKRARTVSARMGQTDLGNVALPGDVPDSERTRWIIVPLKVDNLGRGSVAIELTGLGAITVPVMCREPAIVRGTILDASTGKPWPGRVHVIGSDGLIRHGEAFKDNATLSEKPVVFRPASYRLPFFYSDGTFEVHVPPGTTEVMLERGFEWPNARTRVHLKPGETRAVTLTSSRGKDMARIGWVSGDTHVHWVRNSWDVNEPLQLLGMVQRAEDIRVINNLTLYQWRAKEQGGTFIKPDHHPMGPVPGMCDASWHVQMAEEYRNDNHYGHINLLGIRKLIEPIATGAGSGGPPGTPDWPTNRPAIAEARRQGGISIEAHNIGPFNASAVPVHVALGLADSLDQLDADHYYRFLNCGFHIGLSNGSDHPARVVGCARVYARMAERDGGPLPFTYERWLDAVRRGRTFTTSGPLLLLKVNEAEPGDTLDMPAGAKLDVEVQAWSRYPLGQLEIVSNGEVLKTIRTSARRTSLRLQLTAGDSRWYCARASRNGEWNAILAPDVAHTSAVYVRVAGREVVKPEAARAWIANIEEHIRRLEAQGVFANEEQLQQAIAEAREGLERYRALAERTDCESDQSDRTDRSDRSDPSDSPIRVTPVALAPITGRPAFGDQEVTGMDVPEDAPSTAMQIGNFTPKPSNTGKDWTPTGRTIYNLAASRSSAAIVAFGLDTEGGDRAKTNLLREPIRLILTLDDGTRIDSAELPAVCRLRRGRAEYGFDAIVGARIAWTVEQVRQDLTMRFALSGPHAARVARAELLLPFDPRAMGTTVLAEEWGHEGAVKAPLIISALDMGQVRMSGERPNERLECVFTGSRLHKKIDLRVAVLDGTTNARKVLFRPARLQRPSRRISAAEWARVRRGLISLLQITPFMKPQEDGSGWLGSPGGITGNNVISDPVSCNMDRNLQWLAGMGGAARIMGIDLNKVARKTIEFWLNQRMNADGSLDYVLQTGNISADSNTGVLNAATDYYLSTRDRQFVEANRAVLVRAADYLIARDLDGDGLIETFRDGNGRNQFGDTGYDTISSGWKNALVNGQAYKSLLGVARMMRDIGESAAADRYASWAVQMRRVYNRTFFDAAKRRYIWWIGQDGKRHDYANPLIQENAVLFGIVDCLERDAGIRVTAREVMQQLWDDLAAARYFDSAKGRTVRFMAPELGDYTGLYWGIPCNLEDVPDEFNFADYGKHEFPYYCNGGIFPQDTVAAIMAYSSTGMKEKADIIRREIFRRQHQGILPNGSGFYMGVVNEPGKCYSILKWDGTPTDYEGIISRDCSLLQTILLAEDPAAELFREVLCEPVQAPRLTRAPSGG